MRKALVLHLILIFSVYLTNSVLEVGRTNFVQDSNVLAAQKGDEKDIHWFKEQLNIAPKYQEKEDGVLGMSWAHFLTMIFLVCFFVLGLVYVVLRYKRTKQLLKYIEQEVQKNVSS